MNSFDAIVIAALLIVMVIGFRAGLLRSAVTILGYLIAMPIAAWLTSLILPRIDSNATASAAQNSLIFFGVFLLSGIVMGSLLRMAVDETIGHHIGLGDRLGGAALGAIRVVLIAVTLVLIFDQLVPANMQPRYLVGSQFRPVLAMLGQKGFKTLPPDVTATIDQWKRDHRL
jgi:membrane protein required for colicin V production